MDEVKREERRVSKDDNSACEVGIWTANKYGSISEKCGRENKIK